MNTNEYIKKSQEIADVILKSLNIPDSMYRIVYGGKAIAVVNKGDIEKEEDTLYIWLRIAWNKDMNNCNIQLANINIPTKYRRQGRLSSVMKNLKSLDFVDYILVLSVCTEEMKNFCEKYRYRHINKNDYIVE